MWKCASCEYDMIEFECTPVDTKGRIEVNISQFSFPWFVVINTATMCVEDGISPFYHGVWALRGTAAYRDKDTGRRAMDPGWKGYYLDQLGEGCFVLKHHACSQWELLFSASLPQEQEEEQEEFSDWLCKL